jgi:hypothetical protein
MEIYFITLRVLLYIAGGDLMVNVDQAHNLQGQTQNHTGSIITELIWF